MNSFLMMRRSEMGQDQLPYDSQIEYLESSGTQWIDTGITVGLSDSVVINMIFEFSQLNTTDNNIICGSYQSQDSKRLFTFVDRDGYWKTTYGDVISSTATCSSGVEYDIQIEFRNGYQNLIINGSSIVSDTLTKTSISNISQAIFGAKQSNNTIISPSKIKLKEYNISINGNLVLDFISVRINTIGYMYDNVSGQLFGNSGTGNFICGPDIN